MRPRTFQQWRVLGLFHYPGDTEQMTIAGVVTSLDEVPEVLREHYEQGTDGQFRLAIQGMVDKSRLDEFRNNNTSLKKQLEGFSGVDMDEIAQMRERIATADRKTAEGTGDWAAREAQVRKEMAAVAAKERETGIARLGLVESALDQEVRISRAVAAIAEAKGSTKVLLPHVLEHTRMIEQEDGQFAAVVVDEKGHPRIGDSEGGNMTLGQFVESLKVDPDFARVFDGSGSSGGGSTRSVAGGDSSKTIAADDSAAFMANLEGIADGSVNAV